MAGRCHHGAFHAISAVVLAFRSQIRSHVDRGETWREVPRQASSTSAIQELISVTAASSDSPMLAEAAARL